MTELTPIPVSTVQRFYDLQEKALNNLESILDDEGADEGVRLRASIGVLDYMLKLAKLNKDKAVIELAIDDDS